MSKILALTFTRTTATAAMGHGPARPAAAIHGCWTMKALRPAPATVIVRIRVSAARAKRKLFTPAVTAIATALGKNTPAASIVGKAIAELAVHPAMTMRRTA